MVCWTDSVLTYPSFLFYFILIDNKKTAKTEKENNLSITIYKNDTDFCMAFSLFQFYP
jgi:hypothetical protein